MPCWARCSFSSFSGLTFCGIIILPLVMSTMLMVTSHRLTVKLAFSVLVEKPRCSLLNGISSGCIIGMQQHLCAPLVRSSALFKNEIKKKKTTGTNCPVAAKQDGALVTDARFHGADSFEPLQQCIYHSNQKFTWG